MTTELIPQNFGAISTKFQQAPPVDDLSSGIQSSFGLIGYKGKVWSIRYRGEERQLMRDDGDGPRGSIEVVILKASTHISKIWYEQGYVEGSNAAPDCFSNNGIAPEATSAKPQCASCAICPHNQWGSRVTPAGKSGKACADSKRLAVVPLADLNNEVFGGPMLLRVPAASLQDLAGYGQKMQQMGYPYFSIGTKIAFDPAESYPKFILNGLRPLDDGEADIVLGLRDSHTVQRILSENEFGGTAGVPAGPADKVDAPLFEQAPNVGAANADDVAKAAALKAASDKAASDKAAQEATAKAHADQVAAEAATAAAANAATNAAAEKARKKAELAAAMAALEAEEDAAVTQQGNTSAPPPVTEEKAAIPATTGFGATSAAPVTQTAAAPAPSEGASENMASSFEADLDSMLADLLP